MHHGAEHLGAGTTRFRVWAPQAAKVSLELANRAVAMEPAGSGYWEARIDDAPPGTRYWYAIDGRPPRPDPASRFQPDGVHAPSEVVETQFEWRDAHWRGLRMDQCVIYELHTGTFTPEGTFEAIIAHLPYLRDLGITMIELMPVAQFPGSRNWGYDGAYPFAAQNSYGGPVGLKRLVDACHRQGLGVALDVVYNHFGPEGSYFAGYGPYFTDRYSTPWGAAINFDGPGSPEVRRFFIENALYWIRDCHIDGLRLDAVHSIFDRSEYPFLEELGDAVHAEAERLNRQVLVMPESNLNDPRLVRSKALGGFGLDAQWTDDFHHALRVLITDDRKGYYQDYGELQQLAKSFEHGYVYTGEHSALRQRPHGEPTADLPADKFVVFSQNHDHVGNRVLGERLGHLVSPESLKLAAAAVILSPHVPMLFMGEEYGEAAPFQYFVSHSDPDLVEAVRRGRKEEFAAFGAGAAAPDPQAVETFLACRLDRARGDRALLDYYRELLRLRREIPALACLDKEKLEVTTIQNAKLLIVRRWQSASEAALVLCFSESSVTVAAPPGRWEKIIDSADTRWGGPGSSDREWHFQPRSAVLFAKVIGA